MSVSGPRSPRPVSGAGERLNSWKEIAAYLDRDVRTVQRWEHTKSLPVHRLGEGKRVPIYALRSELDEWCRGAELLDAEMPPAAHRRAWLWGLMLGGILVAGALTGWWRYDRIRKPQPRVVPLTTYSGVVRWPTFSPDGAQVAFAWNGGEQGKRRLYVKMVNGGDPQCLFQDGIGGSPAWSPDGNWIAFPRGGAVYVISPLGQSVRKVADGANSVTWMPDGKSLVISSSESFASLYLVSLETGERRKLTTPSSDPSDSGSFASPAVSPDARQIAFVRFRPGIGRDIFIMPILNGVPLGSPWRLTWDDALVEGLVWASDGREIIFSSDRAGRRSLWRIAVRAGAVPERIAGTDEAINPAISRGPSSRLAYQHSIVDRNIWRMELSAAGKRAGPASPILDSKADDYAPQFSPDGHRMAFVSSRSGSFEIWVSASDGSRPVQLTTFRGPLVGVPRWSPDGRRLLINAITGGNMDIWVVNADGGELRRLTRDAAFEARGSWSGNGRWIYFRSNKSGTEQIWKMPADGGDAVQITRNGGWEAFESPDGKLMYYANNPAKPEHGIWSMPVNGGQAKCIAENGTANFWGVADHGIYYLDFSAAQNGAVPLMVFSFESGKTSRVAAIEKIQLGNDPGFTISRDGRWVAWAQFDRFESNLMMVDNFN
jgi:Tol biopolymer transport system component